MKRAVTATAGSVALVAALGVGWFAVRGDACRGPLWSSTVAQQACPVETRAISETDAWDFLVPVVGVLGGEHPGEVTDYLTPAGAAALTAGADFKQDWAGVRLAEPTFMRSEEAQGQNRFVM